MGCCGMLQKIDFDVVGNLWDDVEAPETLQKGSRQYRHGSGPYKKGCGQYEPVS